MRYDRLIHQLGKSWKGSRKSCSFSSSSPQSGKGRCLARDQPGPKRGAWKTKNSGFPGVLEVGPSSRPKPQLHSGFPSPVPLRSSPSFPLSLHYLHPRRRTGNRGLPAPPRRRDYGGAGAAGSSSSPGRGPLPVPAASPPQPGPRPHQAGPSSALLTRSSDPPPGSSRSP